MTEPQPTDTEILEFLLSKFQMWSPKMNGQHSWRFQNDWTMGQAVGQTARDAVIVCMRAQEESVKKMKEKYPEWSEK
jgi:nitrogen regulatory protein PII-like uncharacterized protein